MIALKLIITVSTVSCLALVAGEGIRKLYRASQLAKHKGPSQTSAEDAGH